MHKIAESMHYEVYREYETVLLKMKHLERTVTIGDFYGDVGKVIISPEEECCVMAGCGVIVYYRMGMVKDVDSGRSGIGLEIHGWRMW